MNVDEKSPDRPIVRVRSTVPRAGEFEGAESQTVALP